MEILPVFQSKKTFKLETSLETKLVKYEKRKKSFYSTRKSSINNNPNLKIKPGEYIIPENKHLLIFEPAQTNFYTSHKNFFPSNKIYVQDKKKKKFTSEGKNKQALLIKDSEIKKANFPLIRKDLYLIENLLAAKRSSKSPERKEAIKDFKKELKEYSAYLFNLDQEKFLRQEAKKLINFRPLFEKNSQKNKGEKIKLKEISENKFMSKVLNSVQRKVSYYNERNIELKEDFVLNLIKTESNEIVSNFDLIMKTFCNSPNFSEELKNTFDKNEKNNYYPFINSIFDNSISEESPYLRTEPDIDQKRNFSSQKSDRNFLASIDNQSTCYRSNGFLGLNSNKSTRSRFAFSALSPINEKELDETLKNSIRNSSHLVLKERLEGKLNTDGNVETDDGGTKRTKDETQNRIFLKNRIKSDSASLSHNSGELKDDAIKENNNNEKNINLHIPSELKQANSNKITNNKSISNEKLDPKSVHSKNKKIKNGNKVFNNKVIAGNKNLSRNSKDSINTSSVRIQSNKFNKRKSKNSKNEISITDNTINITNSEKLENSPVKRQIKISNEDLNFTNLNSIKDSGEQKKYSNYISSPEKSPKKKAHLNDLNDLNILKTNSSQVKSESSMDSTENKDVIKGEEILNNINNNVINDTGLSTMNENLKIKNNTNRKRASVLVINSKPDLLLHQSNTISGDEKKPLNASTDMLSRRNTVNFSSLLNNNNLISKLEDARKKEIETQKINSANLELLRNMKNNNFKKRTDSLSNKTSDKSREEKNSSNNTTQNLVTTNLIMKKLNSKSKELNILPSSPKKSILKTAQSNNLKNPQQKNITSLLELIKQQEKIKSKKLQKTP